MKTLLPRLGVAVAMLLAASSAFAAGVNLSWQSCAALGGLQNRTFACDVNTGASAMVGTFTLGDDLAPVSGTSAYIDLISQQPTLPPWWELRFSGACRPNSLTIDPYDGDGVTCADWANGLASMNIASYVISGQDVPPGGLGPNTARIKVVTAVDPSNLQSMIADTEYGMFELILDHGKTVGSPSCGGCTNPVCIVLNSVVVYASVGGNGNGAFLGSPTSPGSNQITWQGAGADCQAVPIRNATWGRVKALYR